MARKYEEIWERVKKNGHCEIEVLPFFWARVKKAIIKEKNIDAAFRLLNDHDTFILKFEATVLDVKGQMIPNRRKISLKQTLGLEDRVQTV